MNYTISNSDITVYKYTFFVTYSFNARCMYTMYKTFYNIFTYHSYCHVSEASPKRVRWFKLSGGGMHNTLEK